MNPTKEQRAHDALRAAKAPNLFRIRTRILVHRKRTGPGRCPCCGSPHAEIFETRPDLDVLISRKTGKRVFRWKNPKKFDELAAKAHVVDIDFRCHEKQLPVLLNDKNKAIVALCGNRAGKTEIGACRVVRRWLLRGGKNRKFALVSPDIDRLRIWVDKIVLGEYPQPPVLPLAKDGRPMLAVSWPKPEKKVWNRERIHMFDGSELWLYHASARGKNFRGWKFVDAFFDEPTAVDHAANWTILLARLIDYAGTLYASTTPAEDDEHWLKDVIDRAAVSDSDDGTIVVNWSAHDNPWLPPGEVQKMRDEAADELTARREVDGEWVGNRGQLWKHFDENRHTRDGDSYRVEDYFEGIRNVTLQATRKHWRDRNPYSRRVIDANASYVAGQDFNTWPMTAVVCSVFGDPADQATWRMFVVDEVQLGREGRGADSESFGEWLAWRRGERTRYPSFPDLRIACDPSGAYYSVHTLKRQTGGSAVDAALMSKAGHDCRPCHYNPDSGEPMAPPQRDCNSLMNKLFREDRLIIHGRCKQLMLAVQTQKDNGSGEAVKKSSTASDRLSSPTDALRYLVWAIFSSEYKTPGMSRDVPKSQRKQYGAIRSNAWPWGVPGPI